MSGTGNLKHCEEQQNDFHTGHFLALFKFDRCVMLGSIWGCAQVAMGCSNCEATLLPALACTTVPMGPPQHAPLMNEILFPP
eukprot:1157799-Pelagomonas_calceolata.AAC.3